MLFLRSLLLCMLFALSINAFAGSKPASSASSWQIPDTGVVTFYSDRSVIREPKKGDRFFGQDAQYQQHSPGYKDNGDGTVTDLVTGLMWQKDMGEKLTYAEVFKKARSCRTGGYDDWRVPTKDEMSIWASEIPANTGASATYRFWTSESYDEFSAWAWDNNAGGFTSWPKAGDSLSTYCVRGLTP